MWLRFSESHDSSLKMAIDQFSDRLEQDLLNVSLALGRRWPALVDKVRKASQVLLETPSVFFEPPADDY